MDGTGPCGQGKMTGRGRGNCEGTARMAGRDFCFSQIFKRALKSPKNQLDLLELEERLLTEELEALRAEKKSLQEGK